MAEEEKAEQEKEQASEASGTGEKPGTADAIELGGSIELRGFSDMDRANMVVLKKIIGSYARKMSDTIEGFEKLSLTMKKVHEREKSEKYEIHAKLLANGKVTASNVTDRNLFVVIDSVLKKLMSEIR